MLPPCADWKALPHDGWRFETLNFWIRFPFHDFRFHIPCFENPFVFVLFSFLFWRLPLIGGGGGCIRPIVARVTWDFACVFVCVGSGILFVSLEKVFILALEGARFPSLLTLRDSTVSIWIRDFSTVGRYYQHAAEEEREKATYINMIPCLEASPPQQLNYFTYKLKSPLSRCIREHALLAENPSRPIRCKQGAPANSRKILEVSYCIQ